MQGLEQILDFQRVFLFIYFFSCALLLRWTMCKTDTVGVCSGKWGGGVWDHMLWGAPWAPPGVSKSLLKTMISGPF